MTKNKLRLHAARTIAALALLATACSGSISESSVSAPPTEAIPSAGDPPAAGDPSAGIGAGLAPGESRVFAHTADQLFAVDPQTLSVTRLGVFKWPGLSDAMTDIAVNRAGQITGISFSRVYRVDPATLVCTELAVLTHPFVGLSYVNTAQEGGDEVLLATASTGEVFRVDPTSGTATPLGALGDGLGSSGDVVSVKHFGTLATVTVQGSANDWLARVDPLTGRATLIGDTGFARIWGLGFWKDQVYGFTDAAQFVLLDPVSGRASLVSAGGGAWWGAGVTTSAPVIR